MKITVQEITPKQAVERIAEGACLVDVREDDERAAAMAEGARGIALAELIERPMQHLPDQGAEILLICASGRRSLCAAEALVKAGYNRPRSVAGGTQRWIAEGLPTLSEVSASFRERYSRHLLLPEVGLKGQRKLAASRVALVGAGGLGSPIALYLAAAGVGHLTVIDDDLVERSNLQRQILHSDAAIGQPKVISARRALLALNPEIEVLAVEERLLADNAERLLGSSNVVIDGADNFPARYLINDTCVRLGVPMVYGAVQRFDGQAAVFWPACPGSPGACYRCLFPVPPPAEFAPNCAEAGVLGVLPGLIGLLQATETLKLLLGIGEPLINTLMRVDALGMQFHRLGLSPDPQCPACGGAPLTAKDLLPVCSSTPASG